MKLSQFKFNLPKEQVALYPHSSKRVLTRTDGSTQTFTVTRRDEGRLMVLHRKSGTIDIRMFSTTLMRVMLLSSMIQKSSQHAFMVRRKRLMPR